jgi:hypothetical protein
MSNTTLKKYRNLDETQKFAVAIPVLFLLNCAIKSFVEKFRISQDFHWIYVYGSMGALILCFLLYFFSLANSISIIRDLKTSVLKKVLWVLLSSSVFLLITILSIIIIFEE